MPQAIVDPEELRRFALSLKKFSGDVQERMTSLNGQMAALERSWRDQEQKKFAEEFQQQIQVLARFIEMIDTPRPLPAAQGGDHRGVPATKVVGRHEPVCSGHVDRRPANDGRRRAEVPRRSGRRAGRPGGRDSPGPGMDSPRPQGVLGARAAPQLRKPCPRPASNCNRPASRGESPGTSRPASTSSAPWSGRNAAWRRRKRRSEAVQHWELAIDRAVDEFQQNRTRFATWLDTDLLRAVAALNRMSESLESYISLEAPAGFRARLADRPPPG